MRKERMKMDEICTIKLEPVDMNIGTSCLICGKTVEYTNEEALALIHAGNYTTKVCDECKKAIEWVKEKMKDKKE